jgi:nitrile hydratase
MTDERNQLAELFAACWKDEALKARFMADPKAVLGEYGLDVPANIDVNVVENSDNTVHITMPQAPAGAADLSDEELNNAAGGASYIQMTAACDFCA